MAKSQSTRLNLLRGLLGAVLWGGVGVAAPAATLFAITVARWLYLSYPGTSVFDLRVDLVPLSKDLIAPVIGCAAVLASAGWAAYAPVGAFRFAKSLAIVFAMSLPLWFILTSIKLTPRRFKSAEHPAMYPSEFLVIVCPPSIVAALVTAARTKRQPEISMRQD
jgi:hypothetical protein